MEAIVEAIYKMVGSMVEFPEGVETPQLRVKRIFEAMDTVRIFIVWCAHSCNMIALYSLKTIS